MIEIEAQVTHKDGTRQRRSFTLEQATNMIRTYLGYGRGQVRVVIESNGARIELRRSKQ